MNAPAAPISREVSRSRSWLLAASCVILLSRLAKHVKHAKHNMRKSEAENAVPPIARSQIIPQKGNDDPQSYYDPADGHG